MRIKIHRRAIGKVMVLGLLLLLLSSASFFQETTNAQISTQVALPAPSPAPSTSDLNVMTWNILGGRQCKLNRRMEKVAEEVMRHANLDVIALQEVYRAQALKLAEHLREADFGSFSTHFVMTKVCDNGNRGKDFGIAILSRRSIIFRNEEPLLQAPERSPYTGKLCDKGEKRKLAGVVILVGIRPVHIYTTHLTSCGGFKARIAQAEVITRRIRGDERSFERMSPFAFRPVLMGDMNTRPLTGAYSVIVERFRDVDPGTFTYHTLATVNSSAPRIRIDYIFYGRGDFKLDDVSVTSSQMLFGIFDIEHPEDLDPDAVELPVPDHRPVTAHLSYD